MAETINYGRVGFVVKGEYSPSTPYVKYDIVNYNRSQYVALKPVTGIPPSNDGVNWKLFIDMSDVDAALAEAEEYIGKSAPLAAAYDPKHAYSVGNVAVYNHEYYYCITATSGTDQSPEAFDWNKWKYIPVSPRNVSYNLDQISGNFAPSESDRVNARRNLGVQYGGITPEHYGAKGDGVTDDYEPLAFAIQEAQTNNVPVVLSPGKVYAISDDLQVTARIQIYGNGATIKATAAMEACIFVTSSEGQFPEVNRRAIIRDLAIDCNDLSWAGLDITNVQGIYLDNIDIRYMTNVGLNYRNNFGVFARNIRIAGHNSGTHAGTIVGLRAAGHDSYFTNIVVVDCDIGVQNLGAVNQYDHIHVWNVNPNVIPTSIMFDAHRGFQATNCYLDTCAVGVNINTEWPEFDRDKALSIVNWYILHGGSGSGEHMTPEIMGSVIPCVFHVDDAGWVGKIKASGLVNVKPNETYNLFNLDPGISADYDWLKENDTSIRAMGNVPQPYADNALVGDDGDTDNTPYINRASGGVATVHGYERDKLVGGTVCWNQWYSPDRLIGIVSRGTVAIDDNKVITVTCTQRGLVAIIQTLQTTFLIGHVCMVMFEAKCSNASNKLLSSLSATTISNNAFFAAVSPSSADEWLTFAGVKKIDVGDASTLRIAADMYVNDTVQYRNILLFDLTAMFGSAIADYVYGLEQAAAGAGVAWFQKLFPKPYYAYNTGELMSVKAIAHEMVGFNQCDEEWELGGILYATGENYDADDRIRSKNYIHALPDTTYYMRSSNKFFIYAYDANLRYIQTFMREVVPFEISFITPPGTAYLRVQCQAVYGTTYKNDICVNISDASRNGEYEPYIKRLYPLDSSLTLRGIPKLDASNKLYYDGDTYENSGKVTRKYGIVNLGSLTWNRYTDAGANAFFQASVAGRRYGANIRFIPSRFDFITHSSSRYGFTRAEFGNEATDNSIGGLHANDSVVVRADAYATASAFKAAVNGVYVVYELATPTTDIAMPYAGLQAVDAGGTEEYVDSRDVPIPVGHETFYPENLREKLEELIQTLSQ